MSKMSLLNLSDLDLFQSNIRILSTCYKETSYCVFEWIGKQRSSKFLPWLWDFVGKETSGRWIPNSFFQAWLASCFGTIFCRSKRTVTWCWDWRHHLNWSSQTSKGWVFRPNGQQLIGRIKMFYTDLESDAAPTLRTLLLLRWRWRECLPRRFRFPMLGVTSWWMLWVDVQSAHEAPHEHPCARDFVSHSWTAQGKLSLLLIITWIPFPLWFSLSIPATNQYGRAAGEISEAFWHKRSKIVYRSMKHCAWHNAERKAKYKAHQNQKLVSSFCNMPKTTKNYWYPGITQINIWNKHKKMYTL